MYVHQRCWHVILWDSLVVQWLGLSIFTAMARVQSLVGGNEIPQAT